MNRSRRPSRAVRRIAVRRFRRTLRLEALEDRRLLADGLHVLDLIPMTSGFVAEFNQAVDTAVLDSYGAANGISGSADGQLALAPYGPAQAFRVTHVELPALDPPITAAADVPADADQAADGYVCPLETPPPADFTRLVSSQQGQVFEIFQDPEEDRALWIKSKPQPATGQVTRLAAPAFSGEAELLPARPFDPVRVADQFLAEFGAALGIGDPQAQLVPQIVTVDELGMTHLRYRQFHEGVAVYGSEILVHLGADGQISSANGYGVILSEIDMTPTLSSEAASELALLDFADQYPHLATPPEQLSSTLYVFDPGFLFDHRESGARLVWEIRLAHDASMIDDH